jgi:flagellar motor switch protein FliG
MQSLPKKLENLCLFSKILYYVDDKGIQELLKTADQQKLTIALKTAPEEIKTKLFKNMSNRAAQLLKEDLESLGPTKVSDVEKAQQEIVQQIKDLEAKGKALISRGGEADAMV